MATMPSEEFHGTRSKTAKTKKLREHHAKQHAKIQAKKKAMKVKGKKGKR